MSSEWTSVSIDDIKAPFAGSIAIGPFGSRMKSDCYVSAGISVVRGANLTGGRSFAGDFVFITPEKAAELNSANLVHNDLVFPHRGAIGEVGIVPNDNRRYVLSSSLMKLSCDVRRVHPDFVYYFFKSEAGKFELLKNSSQVGTPGIGQPLTSLRQIKLMLPPLGEQQQIAWMLRALDDRLTLLRETNATLEAIAQALFKSWFIDFDPVRAKMEGRAPEGMDEATADLFPNEFETLALGLVPKGWRIGSFADVARLHKGAVNPLQSPNTLFEHFSLPAFDSGKNPLSELGNEIKSAKTTVPNNAVLISKLNPRISRVWLPVNAGKNAVCSTEFLVFLPKNGISREFLYCVFVSSDFQERLGQLVTGTSNSHQRVKPDSILEMRANLACPNVHEIFRKLVEPIFDKIGFNRLQAQTLVALRDTLLPRLISGHLRLPQITKALEEELCASSL